MLKAFSRASAPFVFATAALSIFAVHCGGDDGTPSGTAGTPSGGTGTAGSAVGGSTTGGGGSGTAGSGTSGSATGGGGSGTGGSATGGGGAGGGTGGGGTGGAGGTGGGTGGSGGSGGSGGAGGSGGSGGGNGATFAQVKQVLSSSCAGNQCHSEPSQHIDWVTETGLYERLTTVIGNKGADCKGSTPVVAGDANSLLIRIVKGNTMCVADGGGMQDIPRMPNKCGQGGGPQCLTEDKIKIISDWIAAGAPQ